MTRFDELLDRYLSESISEKELHEFFDLVNRQDSPIKETIMQFLLEESFVGLARPEKEETLFNKIIERSRDVKKSKILSIQKFWWVAASIVLVLGIGAFLLLNKNPKNQLAVEKPSQIKMDIAPPNSPHAIITIASGEKIILDSAQNGSLAKQGNVNLVKLADGELVYRQSPGVNSPEITYNTITVPRGSQVVSLTLADGTKVWMNAASSMRYPTLFIGKERKVEITGEAYFEVKHNAAKPFIVKKGDAEVQVLGTHFNVNAYDDESNIDITLLEGAVKVRKANEIKFLSPGQQAEIDEQGRITLNKNVDVEEVMAWKNGLFVFNNTDLELIMRQIGRWYDVEVLYSGASAKGKHYSGYVPRLVNVSRVLHILESAGGVEFVIDGKKIMVKVK